MSSIYKYADIEIGLLLMVSVVRLLFKVSEEKSDIRLCESNKDSIEWLKAREEISEI